jgi:pyoverdine/dityrosine biosynthesis protein Dit1
MCYELHRPTLERQLHAGEPLHMVLPAFPAKSPNLDKVLGHLPDKAEELALRHLQNICDRIGELYAPGARLTICSDGRVFSDLVGVPDEHVTLYAKKLREMLAGIGVASIGMLRLEDVFGDQDFDRVRALLVERYSEPLGAICKSIRDDPIELNLFNGIARFLFEDHCHLFPDRSRTSLRNACKDLAYRVVQRSHAWSSLVEQRFPNALRLSIHPYPAHSRKIGIYLLETSDNWLTPWHGVALEAHGRFMLTKRTHAELLRARLVRDADGQPSHYTLGAV